MRKYNKIFDEVKSILPGFIVSIIIALVSMSISNIIPRIGAATIAILLGIIVGNLFLNQKIFQGGYKFSESNLLSYSIVLLGGTLSISKLIDFGF